MASVITYLSAMILMAMIAVLRPDILVWNTFIAGMAYSFLALIIAVIAGVMFERCI